MSNQAAVSINSSRLFGRKKKQPPQSGSTPETPAKPKPRKLTGLKVAKYEVTEDKITFSNMKGLFKKRWVIEKEYPLYEVTAVESIGNWLSLTWNSVTYHFLLKNGGSFAKLQEQIQTLQIERQTTIKLAERVALRKADLLGIINRSLPIVDSSFDILIGLHAKRVDWRQVEAYSQTLGASFSYKPITLPQMDLDFTAVEIAVKSQVAKDTSKETLSALKAVHGYFTGLKPEDDFASFYPNFEQVKSAVLAYYTLNDLLLAKVVGEKDSKKEVAYLEELLKTFEGTSVRVDLAGLLGTVDGASVEASRGNAVFEVRTLFREQLKQL